jgi:hypothetical protein
MILSEREREYLSWMTKMAHATRLLGEREQLSLSAWLAAGEKRSTWEGWDMIIGPRPVNPWERRKAPASFAVERRKIA